MRFRVFFLLIAMLLAACGGSATPDAEDPGDTDEQTTTTAVSVEDDDETETSTSAGLPSNECVSLGMALSQAAGLGSIAQGGDPADAADSLTALAGAAPAEIADDFEVMAAAFTEFAQSLADAGVDFSDPSTLSSPEGQAALIAAGEAFSAPGVEEASENMSDYLEEVCEG